MIYYITDGNGRVVAQFDGRGIEVKDSHEKHTVDSISDLPGVDDWDDSYRD